MILIGYKINSQPACQESCGLLLNFAGAFPIKMALYILKLLKWPLYFLVLTRTKEQNFSFKNDLCFVETE